MQDMQVIKVMQVMKGQVDFKSNESHACYASLANHISHGICTVQSNHASYECLATQTIHGNHAIN